MEDFMDTRESSLQQRRLQIIMSQLQCMWCSEFMHTPIRKCMRGHVICSKCGPHLAYCERPMCKAPILKITRDFTLERLSEVVPVPCLNKPNGCTVKEAGTRILDHEETCSFEICPLNHYVGCTWVGPWRHLIAHMKDAHPDRIFFEEKISFTAKNFLEGTGYHNSVKFFYLFGNLFQFSFHVNKPKKTVGFSLILRRRPVNWKKFYMLLELTDTRELHRRYISDNCPIVLSDKSMSFKRKIEQVKVHLNSVIPLLTNGNLFYNIDIMKRAPGLDELYPR